MTTSESRKNQSLSNQQKQQLVDQIKKMLGTGRFASEIRQEIAEEYGLSNRSVGRYLKRARREMIERIQAPVKVFRIESYYFYRSILNNPESTPQERLLARKRIDKLFGFNATKHVVKNTLHFQFTSREVRMVTKEMLVRARRNLLKTSPADSMECPPQAVAEPEVLIVNNTHHEHQHPRLCQQ